MSQRAIKLSLPPAHFFAAPVNISRAIPAPPTTSPFYISPSLYSKLLDKRIPLTIAIVYAVTVHILNSYASKTKPPTPYAFAKTRAFRYFVIAHNLFLAVYSGWTFVGMVTTLSKTIPAISSDEGFVGTVHGLCKIREDNGSGLWQEGLAFYGWLFYLSKFYEVVDTAIILAKGKKSSLLQTYHHAGAMASMYIGIRYMSPPIFLFVLFNSAIHTLMYTYYTLSALHIRVPKALKQSLTTLQISQFLIGGSYAAITIFVKYIPPTLVSNTSNSSSKISDQHYASPSSSISQDFVTCLSHNGEAWAVMLNVFYLTPLTYLFVMFFVRSYMPKSLKGKAPAAVESARKPKIPKDVVA